MLPGSWASPSWPLKPAVPMWPKRWWCRTRRRWPVPTKLVTALFERLGVARVDSLEALMEALKVLHVLGPLSGGRIGAMSTSGGDLTLLADALGPDLTMPPLSEKVAQDLQAVIHELDESGQPL